MAALGQEIVIGTSPTLIFQCVTEDAYKAMTNPGPNVFIAGAAGDPLPLLLILPSTAIIYLGGSGVTSSGADIGAACTGVGSIAYNAIGGDSLYGIVASSTQTVSLLALRQSDPPPFALLTHAAKASTDNNVATTTAISTVGATFISIGLAVQNGVSVVISDSASNTWVAGTRKTNAAGVDCQQFYCANSTTSATHTFTATTTAGSPSIAAASFSGPGTATLDQQSGGLVTTGMTVQPGSITPVHSNELVVSVLADNSSGTPTVAGMTLLDTEPVSGDAYGIGMAYKIQSTATAINPTWTYPSNSYATSTIASFSRS